MRIMIHKAQRKLQRIVFPEGESNRVIRAAQILIEEKIAKPILLGNAEIIKHKIGDLHLHVDVVTIIDPAKAPLAREYAEQLFELRHRKGVTQSEAEELVLNKFLFGAMMVRMHHADGLVGGFTQAYPETIRPALQVIPIKEGLNKISGVYLLITHSGEIYFLADATVNVEPTTEDLAEIAICAADTARRFDVVPRVAFLSFSNFGSVRHPLAEKMSRAVELVKQRRPDLMVDGEMQADTAVVAGDSRADLPVQHAARGRERPGLPQPGGRQHRGPAAGEDRRRRIDRPHPDGTVPAGPRPAPRRRRERHRSSRRDRFRGSPGKGALRRNQGPPRSELRAADGKPVGRSASGSAALIAWRRPMPV